MSNIKYIPYDNRYKQQVILLLQKGLNKNFTEKRFDWLHFQNPMTPSHMLLAVDDERVVGFRAAIRKKIIINNSILVGGRDIDSTLDPEYRGMGIFSKMIKKSLDEFSDIDVYFNFNNKLSDKPFMREGWKPLYYRNMKFVSLNKIQLSKKSLASLYSSLLIFNHKNKATIKEIALSDYVQRNIDHTCEFPISVYKDTKYLNWRYTNPDRSYRFFQVGDNSLGHGLVVCRIENNHCFIIDLINNTTMSNIDVLRHLFSFFKKQKMNLSISAWSQTAKNICSTMFSIPFSKKNVFYVRAAPGKSFDMDIYDPRNWNMMPGESEFM